MATFVVGGGGDWSNREHQIVSGEWGLLDPIEGKRPVVDYCRDLATVMGPKTHLPKSLKYLEEYAAGIQIRAINERWLEGYKGHLLAAPALGKTTASHYFAALCFALKRAERDRLIPRNPADAVARIPVPEAMKVYLTETELQALADHPLGGVLGAEIMRGFFFAVYVGLRVSDVEGLTWGRVERGAKPRLMMLQEKTQVVVGIPLSASAWSLIEDRVIHRHDELVFPRAIASPSFRLRRAPTCTRCPSSSGTRTSQRCRSMRRRRTE
ncbi:MAG: phage integrase SAM-like domain-containing protein [Spirochaetota bacterium]